ncbi:MAG: hypothetical protein Q9227_002819 [Pyrenula ochraceoflavens]
MLSFFSVVPFLAAFTAAAPPSFPLSNGFPNPSPAALNDIQQQALGTLPNGPPPTKLANSSCTSFQVIAFNEIHEVAFFSELLANITAHHPGDYAIHDPKKKDLVVKTITAIIAQEELHALNAETVLTQVCKLPAIQPCRYKYAVSDFNSAIQLASTFTDVVLGTLGDTQALFGANSDPSVIAPVASIIGQEGEQDGYFRSLLGKIPSALPFLTASSGRFAFSAINQNFVVPGSCPQDNFNTIAVPPLGLLVLDEPGAPVLKPGNQSLKFTLTAVGGAAVSDCTPLWVVYINQQNTPVVKKLSSHCEAEFPYDQFEMNGLTLAAVTDCAGPFANADAVAAAALFGPALIEVN